MTTTMADKALSFTPEAAKRPDTYLDARSTGKTIVIDYTVLDRFPAAANVPASAPPRPASANPGKTDPAKNDSEIEALRKELQEIKKQLAEQEAERARSQQNNAVPQE
jgi:hypothetical protein